MEQNICLLNPKMARLFVSMSYKVFTLFWVKLYLHLSICLHSYSYKKIAHLAIFLVKWATINITLKMMKQPKNYKAFPFIWIILCFLLLFGSISICHHKFSSSWVRAPSNPKLFLSMCNYKGYPCMGCHKMGTKVNWTFNS